MLYRSGDHPRIGCVGSAGMVGLRVAWQIGERSFNAAMQLRDRGLSLISQGLARDGVPVEVL